MTYSPSDRLRVLPKISSCLPVPGAADIWVRDVIYGGQGDQLQYVFTVEYTTGVIRGKRRQVRVATFSEARGRKSSNAIGPVRFASEDMSILKQYAELAPSTAGPQAG